MYSSCILKVSACTSNEQEEKKKGKKKEERRTQLCRAMKEKCIRLRFSQNMKAALPMPGILVLILIICVSFIPGYPVGK